MLSQGAVALKRDAPYISGLFIRMDGHRYDPALLQIKHPVFRSAGLLRVKGTQAVLRRIRTVADGEHIVWKS